MAMLTFVELGGRAVCDRLQVCCCSFGSLKSLRSRQILLLVTVGFLTISASVSAFPTTGFNICKTQFSRSKPVAWCFFVFQSRLVLFFHRQHSNTTIIQLSKRTVDITEFVKETTVSFGFEVEVHVSILFQQSPTAFTANESQLSFQPN